MTYPLGPIPWKNPLYEAAATLWRRCRAVYHGRDAVLELAHELTPAPANFEAAAWKRATGRAPWYPAYARTVAGLVGMVLRKPPTIDGGSARYFGFGNLDGRGGDLAAITEELVTELLHSGRAVIRQDVGGDAAIRWRVCPAAALVSWLEDPDGRLTWAALQRSRMERTRTGRDVERRVFYAVYQTGDSGPEVAAADTGGARVGDWAALRPGNGQALSRIPLTIVDLPGGGDGGEPPKPPLVELADLNLSHFQTAAHLESALELSAAPTLTITDGPLQKRRSTDVKTGPATVLELPHGAKAGYVEPSGSGSRALETALARKRREMASVGARMVDEPTRHAETAEAVQLKAGGDRSSLHAVVNAAERGIRAAVALHSEWAGIPDPPLVTLNRDWLSHRTAPEEIERLMELLAENAITPAELRDALERGEILPPAPGRIDA
ncbi:MAG: DUF4055 domain-containing protein [Alphaproteobacteria bacterium]|nr:DUF4055 domain-containing protein [Alphaproteobacteria bacterium]